MFKYQGLAIIEHQLHSMLNTVCMTGSSIAAAGFCKSETIDSSFVLQPSFESLFMIFISQYIKFVLSLNARVDNTDNISVLSQVPR